MMLRLYKNERGFTLIELLVVLAIIAILAAVAIPALMNYTQRARETRVLGELASFKTVVEAWAVDEGKGYYPDEGEASTGDDPVDPESKTVGDVMKDASIEWPPEDPWGEEYEYKVDDDNRNFIIYTINEPDGEILYVTNTTDPDKAKSVGGWISEENGEENGEEDEED